MRKRDGTALAQRNNWRLIFQAATREQELGRFMPKNGRKGGLRSFYMPKGGIFSIPSKYQKLIRKTATSLTCGFANPNLYHTYR